MNVVIFGATGMIGSGVLLECLEDSRVRAVLAPVRTPSGMQHEKLRELVRTDFFDYGDVRDEFDELDACFFCLGVSSFRMDEATYTRLTYDLAVAAGAALAAARPGITFCYVSGAGTDSTERGRVPRNRRRRALARNRAFGETMGPTFPRPPRGQHDRATRPRCGVHPLNTHDTRPTPRQTEHAYDHTPRPGRDASDRSPLPLSIRSPLRRAHRRRLWR